jgi:23S rRNA (cytidine2498-2'-O)-methyltransferase
MQGAPNNPFLFTVCQTGAEPALKKELARHHPELKFAYSRPGFVTFKSEKPLPPDLVLGSVFARAYGFTLGKSVGDPAPLLERARSLPSPACVHVFERDQHVPGDEPLGFDKGAWARAASDRVRLAAAAASLPIRLNEEAKDGESVLDLIVVDENEWWMGEHRQGPGHSPFPGGRPRILSPAAAPSRAYLKLEEAIRWSGARMKPGDIAIEVGSAPGGASYALLARGLRVVGIDPGRMDPVVLESRDFAHVRKPVAEVAREELPEDAQWLLLDMNVAPSVSLYAVDRLAAMYSHSLLGLLLTVKLNTWKVADEIPGMIEHVRSMGMAKARATQLASNRQEIFIYGQTRLAARR